MIWTDWREADGKGCPVLVGTIVEIEARLANGVKATGIAMVAPADVERPSPWFHIDFGRTGTRGPTGKILRYRERRYAAGDLVIRQAAGGEPA